MAGEYSSDLLDEMMSFDLDDLFSAPEPVAVSESVSGRKDELVCPVPRCAGARFMTAANMRRHWANSHMREVLLYSCIIDQCSFSHVRDDKVRDHIRAKHMDAFRDEKEREESMRSLVQNVVSNRRYLNPGNVVPPTSRWHTHL